MRFAAPAIVVVVLGFGGGSLLAEQQKPSPAAARTMFTVAPEASVLQGLSGLWDYNAELSVDAATGRPEQAPRSAAGRPLASSSNTTTAPRPPVTGGANGAGAPAGSSGGAAGGGGVPNGGGNATFDEARRTMALILAAERRTLLRDLLEVPEKLTIRATADNVSITDDLKRERVEIRATVDGMRWMARLRSGSASSICGMRNARSERSARNCPAA